MAPNPAEVRDAVKQAVAGGARSFSDVLRWVNRRFEKTHRALDLYRPVDRALQHLRRNRELDYSRATGWTHPGVGL